MTFRFLAPILALAAAFRLVCLLLFGDTFYDTGRMIPLYDLAANWADTGHFWSDDAFVTRACIQLGNAPLRRNPDFMKVREGIKTDRSLNHHPHISDTWGYAALLGAIWRIAPTKSFIWIQLLQIGLSCCAIALLAWTLIALFGRTTLVVVALYGMAVFPPFAFLTILPNRDFYAGWGCMAALFFFVKGLRSQRGRIFWWLAGGVEIALVCWVRISVLLIPVVFAVWLLFSKFPRRIRLCALVAACMNLPAVLFFLIPFSLQYHERYGTYDFTLGVGGSSTLEGIGAYAPKYARYRNDLGIMERARELGYPADSAWWTPDFGRLLTREAVHIVNTEPMLYASAVAQRYVRFFFTRPPFPLSEHAQISFVESGGGVRSFLERHPVIGIEKFVKTGCAFLMPPLAILALVRFRSRWREVLLLLLIWQYRILIFVGGNLEDRYVMECYFPVLVLSIMTLTSFFVHRRSTIGEDAAPQAITGEGIAD